VICEFLVGRFLLFFDLAWRAMQLKKKWKDFNNVAIKRVKSNALALILSSDSNIDEGNNAKHAKILLEYNIIS